MQKRKRLRNTAFLRFAKGVYGACCLCGAPACDLHHFGDHGMGQKGDDYLVCRICRKCHSLVQGKRRFSFLGKQDGVFTIEAMEHDALVLILEWIRHLRNLGTSCLDDDTVRILP